MYTPHTVTIYNFRGENVDTLLPELEITILRGVFLDISQGENIMKSGLANADSAILYIPMYIKAINAETGQEQQYLPPMEYDRQEDKSVYWTVGTRDKESGSGCFFVKGEVVDTGVDYNSINDRYDYAYRVSSVDVRDFGSPEMQHWQVGGK